MELPSELQWRGLTALPEKKENYAQDLYFREAWPEFVEVLSELAPQRISPIAFLCAKPDAVVGRRLLPMLDFVVDHGFMPIATAPFCFTRHSMREIWRYDWHVYPADRLLFSTFWYTSVETLVFVLEDRRWDGVPGSVRLSELKGSAALATRHPGDLRSTLHTPNSVLNFVHIPDEPADIVRELGILFERPRRLGLLEAIEERRGVGAMTEVVAYIRQLEARCPPHDLDVMRSLHRLHAASCLSSADQSRLQKMIVAGRRMRWTDLCELIDVERASRWDVITVASHLIPLERTVGSGLLPQSTLAHWAGSLASDV